MAESGRAKAERDMKIIRKIACGVINAALLVSLFACAGQQTESEVQSERAMVEEWFDELERLVPPPEEYE